MTKKEHVILSGNKYGWRKRKFFRDAQEAATKSACTMAQFRVNKKHTERTVRLKSHLLRLAHPLLLSMYSQQPTAGKGGDFVENM